MRNAVHSRATLHTDSHSTQRSARFSADRSSTNLTGDQDSRSNTGAPRDSNLATIDEKGDGVNHSCRTAGKVNRAAEVPMAARAESIHPCISNSESVRIPTSFKIRFASLYQCRVGSHAGVRAHHLLQRERRQICDWRFTCVDRSGLATFPAPLS